MPSLLVLVQVSQQPGLFAPDLGDLGLIVNRLSFGFNLGKQRICFGASSLDAVDHSAIPSNDDSFADHAGCNVERLCATVICQGDIPKACIEIDVAEVQLACTDVAGPLQGSE